MMMTRKVRLQSRLNSVIMLCLLTAVLVLLAWLSNRHHVEYDWTSSGRHTLSTASQELLKTMPDPIKITSYARKNPLLRDAIRQLVGKYQRHKDNITLRFVNPDTVPDEARALGISVDGEIIVHYQGRTEHVKSEREETFTNALQRLARERERWIVFLEGHGERKALGIANHDLGEWGKQLMNRGYKIQPLNLGETETIPDNTSVVVVAAPQVDYFSGEIDVLSAYIESGGDLLWLHEPGPSYGLDPLAELLNVEFPDGMLIDHAGQLLGINDPGIVLITSSLYPPHAITHDFELPTLFPQARAIETLESDVWTARAILETGNHTWQETGALQEKVDFNQGEDMAGPLIIGVSLEREIEQQEGDEWVSKQQRIVVVGDGDFLSNTYLGNSGNNELGARIINWLSHDDEFINIPQKVAQDTQLNMSNTMLGIIGIGFLFVLPAALVVIGISIGLRRKKT